MAIDPRIDEKNRANRERFLRQRRNLLIISLSLLAAIHYELKISKINILGNEALLPQPRMLATFLWCFWSYLLWRAYTAFRDIREGVVTHELYQCIARVGNRLGPKLLRKTHKDNGVTFYSFSAFTKVDGKQVATVFYTRGEGDGHSTPEPLPISKTRYFLVWVEALVLFVFDTSAFSEYLFPFVIAFIPVGYSIYRVL